jgi:hypothetical protein
MTAAASFPLVSIDGQSGLRPISNGMLRGTKWVWMSMASAKTLPRSRYAPKRDVPTFRRRRCNLTLQAGWTVFIMLAIEE